MVRKFKVIIFLMLGIHASAQDSTLMISGASGSIPISITSKEEITDIVASYFQEKREQGYFGIEEKSLDKSRDTFYLEVHEGRQYKYLYVSKHNVTTPVLWEEKIKTLNIKEFKNWQRKTLSYFENNGFPFASINLSQFNIRGDTIAAHLLLDPGSPIVYDSLFVEGSSSLSRNYLGRYLNITIGGKYNEEDVKSIDKRLRNLPLVKVKQASRVVFYQKKARVILYIDKVVTDRVDAIVGIAPNSENAEANTLLLTGEVNIELNNLFQSAKQMELHWRNYLQRSQLLDASFSWPYIANTKLGVSGALSLNKYDTFFVNVTSKLAFRYQQQANNYMEVYYQNINSNLLNVDTNLIRQSVSIPVNNPFNIDNYGLAAYARDYDYLPNPRKGYEIYADASLGNKTLLRNTLIDQVLFYDSASSSLISIYDTLKKNSVRSSFHVKGNFFIPIKKRSTIAQTLEFRGVFSEKIAFNEQYNFGGFSSLRGFDENEFFASKMLRYAIEYRFILSENSNVGLFLNAAAIENSLLSPELIYDIPIGFGAVANIQVGSGILNLAYALGRQQNNPIQLSAAKFHFGLINYF